MLMARPIVGKEVLMTPQEAREIAWRILEAADEADVETEAHPESPEVVILGIGNGPSISPDGFDESPVVSVQTMCRMDWICPH